MSISDLDQEYEEILDVWNDIYDSMETDDNPTDYEYAYEEVINKPLGSAELIVHDVYEPLFTSAVWYIVAKVDGKELCRSKDKVNPHTQDHIRVYKRHVLRQYTHELLRAGVDVIKTYIDLGGDAEDIKL